MNKLQEWASKRKPKKTKVKEPKEEVQVIYDIEPDYTPKSYVLGSLLIGVIFVFALWFLVEANLAYEYYIKVNNL